MVHKLYDLNIQKVHQLTNHKNIRQNEHVKTNSSKMIIWSNWKMSQINIFWSSFLV
jgi:hypothetical protein